MTSPRVIELPRRLEPVSRDTFLGEAEPVRRVAYVGNVVALRPGDGGGGGDGNSSRRRPEAPAAA